MPRCLLLLLLAACAPSALQLPETTAPALREARVQRTISILTDLDTVRDVALGPSHVYVATDRGLLVYPAEGPADGTRITEGLPSVDVRALSASAGGVVTVGTAGGLVALRGGVMETIPAPPVGELVALHHGDDDVRWSCGTEGLARLTSRGWERYGEPMQCTGLFPTPEGRLWVGTTRGALYLDADDVIREHGEGRGLPAGWVRALVPTQPGQAFALVQNTAQSYLAWSDGDRWYGYTIPDFDRPIVGLGRSGGDIVLLTSSWAFRVRDAATGTGVALRALMRGERLATLSYRARQLPAAQGMPSGETPAPSRGPSRLAAVPPNHPTVDAPGFVVAPMQRVAERAYDAWTVGGAIHVADRNRGVVTLSSEGAPARRLRSKDLVAARDLQVASDERGQTWVLAGASLGVMRATGPQVLTRVAPPEGTRPGSIAAAARGLYLATTVSAEANVLRIYRRSADGWTLVVSRTLTFPEGQGPLVAAPLLGVTDEEEAWVGIRVRSAERESGSRMRGVVVISPQSEEIVAHHAQSDPAVDGEGSLRMPDDFTNIDLGDPSMAWFSTLVGAVRLGNHQAVTFGENRGVRGEVVSDVLVGTRGRVWMAAAEGPGYRLGEAMEFRMPAEVRAARPIALALDGEGNVWGAGPNGLVRYDGDSWTVLGEGAGLPTTELVDIESDAAGRVWVLARDRVLVLGRAEVVSAAE